MWGSECLWQYLASRPPGAMASLFPGMQVFSCMRDGMLALFAAIEKGHKDAVRALVGPRGWLGGHSDAGGWLGWVASCWAQVRPADVSWRWDVGQQRSELSVCLSSILGEHKVVWVLESDGGTHWAQEVSWPCSLLEHIDPHAACLMCTASCLVLCHVLGA